MTSRKLALLVALGAVMVAGCNLQYRAPVIPSRGLLFANYRAPLTGDVKDVSVGSRKGESATYYIRDPLITGLDIGWESAAIEDAARNGGLTKVNYADYEFTSVLGVYGTFKVIAYGD